MKYLITGANGQLGREWVQYLSALNAEIIATTSEQLDITDSDSVTKVVNEFAPDFIINCAAYTKVDLAESDFEGAMRVNRDGVKNLIDACAITESKLVHFSTDYVFSGSEEDRGTFPFGYPEDAKTDPINRYGYSKRAGEIELEKSDIDWLLIRVSWLCGSQGSNFVKTMLRLGREHGEVSVVEDQTGSPSYTFDVVEKTDQLLKQGLKGIYHISSGGEVSWADFAEAIFSEKGQKTTLHRITSDQFKTIAKRPSFSLLNKEKMIKKGLNPFDWRDGLKRLMTEMEGI
tara:strand:- start:9196 stop:10059 length:864 start_codon:yes stop_codon:yes gene_type:complete